MIRGSSKLLSWALILLCGTLSAQQPEESPVGTQRPQVEKTGEGRYRIGRIDLEKERRRFSVPGTVIRLDAPLEFLASAKAGDKAYESLIELEADAYQFNLACILIGLDATGMPKPEHHFDARPVEGPRVRLLLSWETNGQRLEVPVEQLLINEGEPVEPAVWVYMGSTFEAGVYLAARDGTLVGFVHDPASIIEHRTGLGLGNYGALGGNSETSPPVGSGVLLTVIADDSPGTGNRGSNDGDRKPGSQAAPIGND